jgi:hypothetical protein
MKLKWISFSVFSLFSLFASAQTTGYKYFCVPDAVKESGFYKIELTPEINAHVKTDYSDIRIVNKQDKWVPHIVVTPANNRINETVIMNLNFSIPENSSKNSIVLIESPKTDISNIGLAIKNTAAKRFCTLSGSDDQKKWFVINDSIVLDPVADNDTTAGIVRVDFPPSNYKYFKITIYNNHKDPFHINGVVQYTHVANVKFPENKIIQNPANNVTQKDSGKTSYIKVSQQQGYHFNNIGLQLTGSKYFYRKAGVYIPDTTNRTLFPFGKLLQTFTISNNSTLQFRVPLINAAAFYILIENEDNLPLTVKEVTTSSDQTFVAAYLEKGEAYKLIMDNPGAEKPAYDLSHLNSTIITDSAVFLPARNITAFKQEPVVITEVKSKKWILWVVTGAVLLILLFFTQKMIREVDKTT